MDLALAVLMAVVAWYALRLRYQRAHIALLGRHLARFQLERHMETLTQGYTRAIHEEDESRQRHVVDNEGGWDLKSRAFHLSAELYLLQHSCHWYCKSRTVADVRLMVRHQVKPQKVLESVSDVTRAAYLRWF